MPTYANKTDVNSERSRAEIERTLRRYGAHAFMYGTRAQLAAVQFEVKGRRILFRLELPDPADHIFHYSSTGRVKRTPSAAHEAWEQACRQRWRALALIIKAKLEAVEAGISSFELEFLPYTVLPNGTTVGDWVLPQIERALESGAMPPMLPMLPG